MPNNNNCGMHYIHFAKDRTAVHEFEYDNEYISKKKRKTNEPEQQTSVWNMDGTPVKRVKGKKKKQKDEQNQKSKADVPQGKQTSFDILFEMDRDRRKNLKLTSLTKKINTKKKALKKQKKTKTKRKKLSKKKLAKKARRLQIAELISVRIRCSGSFFCPITLFTVSRKETLRESLYHSRRRSRRAFPE